MVIPSVCQTYIGAGELLQDCDTKMDLKNVLKRNN
jgi:hypothetical protein